ncbi:MAG: FtsK/SpoIIIE domain-containing protein, partial [Bdellovibrionales bacterium]
HILVAGQTGGGKSNFLKVVTTVLTKNNPDAKIIFLDFKGGMETADLRNHAKNLGSNIQCFDGTKRCVEELVRIGMTLEERFKVLSELGASNFDDYLKKKLKKATATQETVRHQDEKRTYIIIDEVAQLYSREPEVEKESLNKARASVNRIARQGRASGVHLIVATQKPDASSFDQTVKANLPAVLCFPMANQVSSVSAIGTKRAFEINPNIKGRAVWKFGPKLEEVQTYLFG